MDFLRDTSWQAIIGILGVIAAIVIYFLQRKQKKLAYTVLTETPLLSINDEIKGKIKIKYESKDIQNVNLVMLRIENRGNTHIASSDFEQPISFSFPDSEILSVETTEVSPKNLKPVISTEASKLIINPILLNKGDNFICKIIFSNYKNRIDVDARIVGIKEIEKIDVGDSGFTIPLWVMALGVIASNLFVFLAGEVYGYALGKGTTSNLTYQLIAICSTPAILFFGVMFIYLRFVLKTKSKVV